MRQFISVHDVKDINAMVQKALAYKANPLKDKALGNNKRIGLLFLNPSMRTRLSTQLAAQNLGMEAIVFNVGQDGWALEFEEEAILRAYQSALSSGTISNADVRVLMEQQYAALKKSHDMIGQQSNMNKALQH